MRTNLKILSQIKHVFKRSMSLSFEGPTAIAQPISLFQNIDNIKRRVYIETYGCQMNFNDSDIVRAILKESGNYVIDPLIQENNPPDVILLMTCAIREGAESKIWNRLDTLRAIQKIHKRHIKIGLLGCMAERLKQEILERKRFVDIVCGPDAYRDLPRLLIDAENGQAAINIMLSADETYADIAPVRQDLEKKTAYVSIMRGCNNMCAFCIVPFTRGRERSRPMSSILDEIKRLSDEGIKEVTLLGQNVNSYLDKTTSSCLVPDEVNFEKEDTMSRGFTSVFKRPVYNSKGRFTELLDKVSLIDPSMRIRFTSPHPKDFPDDLLFLMRDRSNICKQIHLPVQSGSTSVLERMRRGYSREAYLQLVDHIKSIIPNVSLSTDIIAGFCGETESEHSETIDLIKKVDYEMAYMFSYSMREKTMAHRRYSDDIPDSTKASRLAEIINVFYTGLTEKINQNSIGKSELVLVEGPSKKSSEYLCGRSDGGRMIVFPKKNIRIRESINKNERIPIPGEFVRVKIEKILGATPVGEPEEITTKLI